MFFRLDCVNNLVYKEQTSIRFTMCHFIKLLRLNIKNM